MRSKALQSVPYLSLQQFKEFFVQKFGVDLADAEGGARAVRAFDEVPCFEGLVPKNGKGVREAG